jgi:long-chain fatty acid transport protein
MFGVFDLHGVDRTVEAARGVVIGGALPIPFGGALRDRVGLGLGFYVPTNVLNRARAPRPGTPFYALLENRSQVIGLQVGVGVRISRRWSVGAGFLALAALRGRIEISADNAGRFTTISEQQLISHFAPIFGARFNARRWTFGATLRFASRSSYDILVANDLDDYLPLTLPELNITGVAQYDPLTLALEAAWRPRRGLLVTGGLAYQHWSDFPLPTENPVVGMPPQEPPGFHDTVVPRIGVEWLSGYSALTVALRAGYFFVASPAPEMKGQQTLLDNHRHAVSVGLGLLDPTGKVPIHVDLWVQGHFLLARHHDRPDGQDDIDTSGSMFVGGLVLGVDL